AYQYEGRAPPALRRRTAGGDDLGHLDRASGVNRCGAVELDNHTEGAVKRVLVLLLLLVCPGRAAADPVIDWNETALGAAFAANLDNLTFGCNDALHEPRI